MAANYELTGLQRTYLETMRGRITKEDGPAHDLAADLTEDGEVKFRPATLSDQLNRLIARWVWSQIDEAVGEVGEETPQEAAARRRDEWIRRFGPIPGSES